ncbi:hypothetical protein CEY09_12205 [Achromobacter marplatensis]|uniref:Uncharacterized protein n=1 Tax=Achromobacter spanius TaxID=217203 RepID=A0A2K8S0D6_9BURK|nr:hypothetical protein CVS48_08460 [Achromobacter spanius]OWT68665.1 hypothetical protein CEY09_12205 [Achromobacter marplatensis]PPA77605.1 hypothetical protein C4E15_06215 [Achromobacter spanius]
MTYLRHSTFRPIRPPGAMPLPDKAKAEMHRELGRVCNGAQLAVALIWLGRFDGWQTATSGEGGAELYDVACQQLRRLRGPFSSPISFVEWLVDLPCTRWRAATIDSTSQWDPLAERFTDFQAASGKLVVVYASDVGADAWRSYVRGYLAAALVQLESTNHAGNRV